MFAEEVVSYTPTKKKENNVDFESLLKFQKQKHDSSWGKLDVIPKGKHFVVQITSDIFRTNHVYFSIFCVIHFKCLRKNEIESNY